MPFSQEAGRDIHEICCDEKAAQIAQGIRADGDDSEDGIMTFAELELLRKSLEETPETSQVEE
jgi:hypothetical protein